MPKGKLPHLQSLTSALEALSISQAIPRALSAAELSTPPLDSSINTRTPSISVPTPTVAEYRDPYTLQNVPWYELTPTKDRGLSLTAARRIPAGTLILSEPPLITIPLIAENDDSAIDAAFEKLSKAERKQYLKFFNAKNARGSEIAGIYSSNCYDIKTFDAGGGSCIGAASSRINHSCLPNVAFYYVPPELVFPDELANVSPSQRSTALQRGLMQFRAIKTISKGRELLSNYEKSIFVPRKTRIERLRRHYGFNCTCEACVPLSDFWEKSDLRRKQMESCIKALAALEQVWVRRIDSGAGHWSLATGANGSGEVHDCVPEAGGFQVQSGDDPAGSFAMLQEPCQDTTSALPDSEMTALCNTAIGKLLELESLLTKEGLAYTPLANCYKSLSRWAVRINSDPVRWIMKELELVIRCFGKDSKRAQMLRNDMGE